MPGVGQGGPGQFGYAILCLRYKLVAHNGITENTEPVVFPTEDSEYRVTAISSNRGYSQLAGLSNAWIALEGRPR